MSKINLVVDSSYIHRQYKQISIIGKGKDFTCDAPCIIYLVREREKILLDDQLSDQDDKGYGKLYFLQIFQGLTLDFFRKKVQQLQYAMTEISLIGKRRINASTYDLYILYDTDQIGNKTLYQYLQERRVEKQEKEKNLSEEEAKELLVFLTQNILLNGRYTNEFLDVNPHNILINSENIPGYDKYVITNFGLSYHGTKFYRRYTCPTDTFFSEPLLDKTVASVISTYAFQIGLIVFSSMINVDVKDFYKDGKYNETLLMQLINFLCVSYPKGDSEKQKQYHNKLTDITRTIPSLDIYIDEVKPNISPQFADILRKLLASDQSKRSILVSSMYPSINTFQKEYFLLDGKHPWQIPGFLDADNNLANYIGIGQPVKEEGTESKVYLSTKSLKAIAMGNGRCYFDKKEPNRFGHFDNNGPRGIGCLEMIEEDQISYLIGNWVSVSEVQSKILYRSQKWIFFGDLAEDSLENGEGKLVYINSLTAELNEKMTPYYGEVKFDQGKIISGKVWYKDYNCFIGEFDGLNPSKGSIFYKELGHVFTGTLKDGKRVQGKLECTKWTFEGDFENGEIKLGIMTYPDQAVYKGTFHKNQRR